MKNNEKPEKPVKTAMPVDGYFVAHDGRVSAVGDVRHGVSRYHDTAATVIADDVLADDVRPGQVPLCMGREEFDANFRTELAAAARLGHAKATAWLARIVKPDPVLDAEAVKRHQTYVARHTAYVAKLSAAMQSA